MIILVFEFKTFEEACKFIEKWLQGKKHNPTDFT